MLTQGTFVKIIRNSALGNYSWDTVNGLNAYNGINQWGTSTHEDGSTYEGAYLMRELNTDYLGNITIGTNGKWYSGANNAKNTAMPSSTLSSSAQNLIQPVLWNTGFPNSDNISATAYNATTLLIPHIYEHERYDAIGKVCTGGSTCNDTVVRKSTWYGKVGLYYVSDYVYATAGGASQSRSTCLSLRPGVWNNYGNCYSVNWLRDSSTSWTISPAAQASHGLQVAYISLAGNMNLTYSYAAYAVKPALYLKKDVLTRSGDGSSTNPYSVSISGGVEE